MKILYLHQYFNSPSMSGGTRSYEMARRWVAAGHEVHMITSERDAGRERDWRVEEIDGITVHWFPVAYDNKMSFPRRILAFFVFALACSRRAMATGGDVVLATSTPLTIAIPAVLTKKRLGVPLVFEIRDLWPEMPIAMGALKNPLAKSLARLLEKWAYRNSNEIVALSPGMKAGVTRRGYPAPRVHVVPNASDVELFGVDDAQGREFRRSRDWLGDRPMVVYAGTLGHVNDVSYLVRVAEAMRTIDPTIAFLIVGDGADGEKVDALAIELGVLGENLFHEGPISKAEMPALLNAATVCTSLFAPIPEMEANSANKFFDALASRRPIAINYGGWQSELVREHGIGIVLPRDPSVAATALRDFLADGGRLHEAAAAAGELAVRRFHRDDLAATVLSVVESATAVSTHPTRL